MKTGNQLKIFFIYLCLWYVATDHICGENPLIPIIQIGKQRGVSLVRVLTLLKNTDPTAYNKLREEFTAYIQCVGLRDTGYFKRSLTEKSATFQDQHQWRGQRGLELPGALQAAVGSSNTLRMLTGKRSVATGDGGGDADGAAQGKSL